MQRISKESFFNIISKAQAKISNWYTTMLSYAGRYTLVNHVLNTLPQYTMNVHKIPDITLNRLNSISKRFLWNGNSNTNKKSPIKWETLNYPKNKGDLGIKNLKILNKAYLLKNTWRLFTDKNSLWCKVIKGKYFPSTNMLNASPPKPYHSIIWKNLFKFIKILPESTFWVLGNGKRINFWTDKWVGNFKIEDYTTSIPPNLTNLKVSDIINWNNLSWNIETLKNHCPGFILQKIKATPIPVFKFKDKPQWAHTDNGIFSLKSAYQWLFEKNFPCNNPQLP